MFLTDVYRLTEEPEKSIEHSEKSIEISKKIGYMRNAGYAMLSSVPSLLKKSDFKKAKQNLDAAHKIFRMSEDALGKVLTSYVVGVYAHATGNLDDAIKELEFVIETLKNMNQPFWLAHATLEYGLVQKKKGNTDIAIQNIQISNSIFRKLGNVSLIKKTAALLKTA
jgi:tetratricopeptide (TPR) repeat protein